MIQIDYRKLKHRCRQSIDNIMQQLGGEIVNCGNISYAYKDNNSKILAVAHLDTVIKSHECKTITLNEDKITFSPMLDDRLGVYTILDMLPGLNINMDILLTDGEESGKSTAGWFENDKSYNWIAEFDRKGDDAVIYYYSWGKTISKYFKLGHGSYSDIAELDGLGCQAVNVGIGYHNEHTNMCYMVDNEYLSQITRFIKFYHAEGNTHYRYDIPSYPQYANYSWSKTWEWGESEVEDDDVYQCPYCLDVFYKSQTLEGLNKLHCPQCGLAIKNIKGARIIY